MTTVLERETVDHGTDNPTRMVHFTDPPYTHGICGAKLAGIDHPDGTPIDCVVCADLDRAGF